MSPILQLSHNNSQDDDDDDAQISSFFAADYDDVFFHTRCLRGLQFFYNRNSMKGRQRTTVRGLRIGVGPERRWFRSRATIWCSRVAAAAALAGSFSVLPKDFLGLRCSLSLQVALQKLGVWPGMEGSSVFGPGVGGVESSTM
jgi:hypothetical protein